MFLSTTPAVAATATTSRPWRSARLSVPPASAQSSLLQEAVRSSSEGVKKVKFLSGSEQTRSQLCSGGTTGGTSLSLIIRSDLEDTKHPLLIAVIFQFVVSEDHSLVIKNPSDFDSGKYELLADNGIGAPVSAETEVIIYPIFPKITLLTEKRSFSPNSEAEISCKITGDLLMFDL